MVVIKCSCLNQRLRKINSNIIPDRYDKLKFEFDFRTEDWNAVTTKTVNFVYQGKNHYADLDENNQCYVPVDVVRSPFFSVSVFGGDIVTNHIKIYVEEVQSGAGIMPPVDNNTNNSGIVFVPSIDENKILSWTITNSSDDMQVPEPVDLWPHDEWSTDGDIVSEYEWEEE